MSFVLIDAKRADVSVAAACSVLGVSVSGFYAWKNRRTGLGCVSPAAFEMAYSINNRDEQMALH